MEQFELYFSGASTTTAAPSRMHACDRRPPMPIASSACIRAAFSRAAVLQQSVQNCSLGRRGPQL